MSNTLTATHLEKKSGSELTAFKNLAEFIIPLELTKAPMPGLKQP